MNKAVTKSDTTQSATMNVAGREVRVVLKANRQARRMILKVDPIRREVVITCPSVRGFSQALAFAQKHEAWVEERLTALPEPVPFVPGALIPLRGELHEIIHDPTGRRRVPVRVEPASETVLPLFGEPTQRARLVVSGDEDHLGRRLTDWLKREARMDLTEATLAHAEAYGTAPARISVRDTSSRWGSCSTTRVINFSWRLIFAPPYALDYVAAHEAAHLIEHNHGPKFWALVEKRIDNIERAKIWLTENGAALHRFGADPICD